MSFVYAAVAFFIFGKRLGALNLDDTNSDSQEFITTVERFLGDMIDLMSALPLYKIYPTKLWKTLVNDQITIHKLSMKMINEKLAEIEEEDRKALEAASGEEEAPEKVDFITYMVHSGKMSVEEVAIC